MSAKYKIMWHKPRTQRLGPDSVARSGLAFRCQTEKAAKAYLKQLRKATKKVLTYTDDGQQVWSDIRIRGYKVGVYDEYSVELDI